MQPTFKEFHRRSVLTLAMAAGSLVTMSAGSISAAEEEKEGGEDVSAIEDLMREHGVLRRTLNVYSEVAERLRAGAEVDFSALADATRLFRDFGEDYHEQMLEETYIFPEVLKAGGSNARLVEVLLLQHERGRSITAYIEREATRASPTARAGTLADALSSFVRMYNAHSAWEDTVLFPAWKAAQSKHRLEELAEKFEDIEHEKFGKDGFENAVARVTRIEGAFGLRDLSQFTAPPPPE